MFTNCYVLQRNQMQNFKISFSMANCQMSAAAIDEMGNNAADLTGLTAQTVTFTGNYGANSADISIWTNKNWSFIN
jgi:hypothetical protein